MNNMSFLIGDIKQILAQAAEQNYNWNDDDTFDTYNQEEVLLRNISPNHIAALLHYTEKFALHYIASKLTPKSVVVEIGTFLGGSAAIMAYGNPSIQIISIDPYDSNVHTVRKNQREMLETVYGEGRERTIENAAEWLYKFHNNVTLHRAYSPHGCSTIPGVQEGIDVYFEDGVHRNPGLKNNIDFWFPKVKSGGLVLMHDYRPWLPPSLSNPPYRFRDVEQHVNALIQQNKAKMLGYVCSLAVLQKV